jgi:hypothetical protein
MARTRPNPHRETKKHKLKAKENGGGSLGKSTRKTTHKQIEDNAHI